jgi:serine/threonine protein kinase
MGHRGKPRPLEEIPQNARVSPSFNRGSAPETQALVPSIVSSPLAEIALSSILGGQRIRRITAHPDSSLGIMGNAQASISVAEDTEMLPRLDALLPEVAWIPDPELKPGDFLGSYRLIRKLGSGGMGVVFEAIREDGDICMRVAVKVLHSELCTQEFLLQMRQEASKLAKLRHPCIARLLDWKLDHGETPYCVLEYIEGESITSWCERHALSAQACLSLFLDVCTPVSFAHRNWVAHLDLKPRNILVKDTGEIRLVDFGIARTLASGEASEGERAVRAFSAPYASPEQIQGGPLSVQSDIYSLGIILRELLGRSALNSGKRKASAPLPFEIEAIAARASSPDPERRYASVSEFQQDLRNYLAKFPVSAVPATPFYLVRKFCRRNVRPLMASLGVAIALAAGLGAWQMRRSADREHVRAQRLRQDVYQLSTTLLFPMEEEMRNLPGATPTRMLAVHTGLQYLQNLSAEAEKEPELQVQLGQAYLKLGDIQGNPTNSNLGDESGAKASYEAARKMLVSNRVPEGRYAYGLVLLHEGDLIYVEGDHRRAAGLYQEAIGVFRGLAGSGAREVRFQAGLESALIDMGDVEATNGQADPARGRYREAANLAGQVLQQHPDNVNYERSLARCLSRLGNLEWEFGRWQPAQEAFRSSLDVYDRLLHAQPDNLKVRQSWIAGAHNLGNVDEHIDRLNEAIDLYSRAEQLAAADVRLDPQDAFSMRDDQVSLSNLTRVFLRAGDLAKAKQSCMRELALAKKLWKLNPDDAMTNDDLAGSEQHLATVQAKQHQYETSIASQREALELLRANVARNRTTENLVEEMDGLLGLADYSLDLARTNPGASAPAKRAAVQALAELHGLEPNLRPNNAEDRDRATKIREIESRLSSNRKSVAAGVHSPA